MQHLFINFFQKSGRDKPIQFKLSIDKKYVGIKHKIVNERSQSIHQNVSPTKFYVTKSEQSVPHCMWSRSTFLWASQEAVAASVLTTRWHGIPSRHLQHFQFFQNIVTNIVPHSLLSNRNSRTSPPPQQHAVVWSLHWTSHLDSCRQLKGLQLNTNRERKGGLLNKSLMNRCLCCTYSNICS